MDTPAPGMIFAFDRENGDVLALASVEEAREQCKAVDVEDGFWLFFSEDGSPLEVRFEPVDEAARESGAVGTFHLDRAMSGLWLQERLDKVTNVSGAGLMDVIDLTALLVDNRAKRARELRKRG